MNFYLTITDSVGNTCRDTVTIRFSSFGYSLLEYQFNINQGDSIHFFGIPFIGSGVPPLNFYWTPSTGLDDSTSLSAWASPDTTTFYSLTAIDSIGCISDSYIFYKIFVNPNSIDEQTNNIKVKIHPNPTSNYLFLEGINQPYNIALYNSLGQLIFKEDNILESNKKINISDYKSQLIFIRIEVDKKVFNHKLIKN